MSGALAERDFVVKLERAGFADIEVVERRRWGIDECALYPLFGPELIELMRKLISPDCQNHIGDSIVVSARLA